MNRVEGIHLFYSVMNKAVLQVFAIRRIIVNGKNLILCWLGLMTRNFYCFMGKCL